MLNILPLQLGPVLTNTYLVADSETKEAVVIDPAWDGHLIVEAAEKNRWQIKEIWITHAHFDHIGGMEGVQAGLLEPVPVSLHPEDLPLWKAQGGAPFFGIRFESHSDPTAELFHGQLLSLGTNTVEVRHAPGHTQGHVMFYFKEAGVLFSGDVIFQGSVGRTDLPGGDWNTLLTSIRKQVLSLPDETKIYSGHGPETTVGIEKKSNPFLLYG
jgi:glyoxylase-like metal-dependent hydrolase (beta-lactamase superfamily II)